MCSVSDSILRNSGESVATYIAALRALAENCSYGKSLKEMLRDRLVCGVNNDTIQRRLLSEKELDYDKAYTLALSIEASERDSKHLKAVSQKHQHAGEVHREVHGDVSGKVNKVYPTPTEHGTVVCYRCGGPHLAPACKFKETECLYCKKKGHLARVCRAKAKANAHQDRKKPPKILSHYVENGTCGNNDHVDGAYGELFSIRDPKCTPITVEVILNDVPVTMEVDTGASTTIINHSTFQRILQSSGVDLQPSGICLKTYTGQTIPIMGCATVQARYEKRQVAVVAQVVTGDGPNLLGRDWLQKLEVDLGSIHAMVLDKQTPLADILDKHSKVFSDELGCMQGLEVHLDADDKVKPKFHNQYPLHLGKRLKLN